MSIYGFPLLERKSLSSGVCGLVRVRVGTPLERPRHKTRTHRHVQSARSPCTDATTRSSARFRLFSDNGILQDGHFGSTSLL